MITYKEDFEATVLRWRSVARSNWVNPNLIKEFENFATKEAERCYAKFRLAFDSGGYNQDDVIGLSKVYLMNYLGNNSLMLNPDKAEKELKKIKDKTPEGLFKKDISNMHLSIRQRLCDAARLCTLKSQNFYAKEFDKKYFKGTSDIFMDDDEFIKQSSRLGFAPIPQSEYKAARRQAKTRDRNFLGNDGFFYKIVTSMPTSAHIYSMDMVPDRELEVIDLFIENEIVSFEQKNPIQKLKILKNFVKLNQGNPRFRMEIREAKKQIKVLKERVATNT